MRRFLLEQHRHRYCHDNHVLTCWVLEREPGLRIYHYMGFHALLEVGFSASYYLPFSCSPLLIDISRRLVFYLVCSRAIFYNLPLHIAYTPSTKHRFLPYLSGDGNLGYLEAGLI